MDVLNLRYRYMFKQYIVRLNIGTYSYLQECKLELALLRQRMEFQEKLLRAAEERCTYEKQVAEQRIAVAEADLESISHLIVS